MGITEEEARALGLVQDKRGDWYQPRKSRGKSRDSQEVPEPQPPVRGKRGAADKSKKGVQASDGRDHGRFTISVVSYSRRDTDPDNITPKAFIDCLVERNYLPDDSSKYVREVVKRVVKIIAPEPERTVIEIWREDD